MITNFSASESVLIRAIQKARLSWDREEQSDSVISLGPKDKGLAMRLLKAGGSHSAALRQAVVWFDLTATRGLWQHIAKYRAGVEMYSQSIQHTGLSHEYKASDFRGYIPEEVLTTLNKFAEAKDLENLTNLMPEGYLQRRSMMMSYPAMRAIYKDRIHHRKAEWKELLAELVAVVPYPELIV